MDIILTFIDLILSALGLGGVSSMVGAIIVLCIALILILSLIWNFNIVNYFLSFLPPSLFSPAKWIASTLATILFVLLIYKVIQNQPKPNLEYSGTLASNPGSIQPSSSPLFTFQDKSKLTAIEIGDSCLSFDWRGEKGKPVFNIVARSSLVVERIDEQVKVSTEIFGRDGRFVARLNRNVWDVNPETSYQLNYTSEALEVIDDYEHVVLQVRVLPDRIQLQGEWWDDTGRGVRLAKAPINDGRGIIIAFLSKGNEHPHTSIRPMFKYPAKKHLGETDIVLFPAPPLHVCTELCKALKGSTSSTCLLASP